jgi:formamidopyrimidine-DNA glycosylase
MLNGKFYIFKDSNSYGSKIIELLFEDKTGLVLIDKDNYANVKFNPEVPSAPDAISKEFTFEYLEKGLKKRKLKNIKDLLVDQKFVRGIGNAYIDEILWEAKIHPASSSGKIPDKVVERLYSSINKVLTEAEKEILKRDPEIINGEIRDFLKVHNHKLKHSPTGGTIKKETFGNRITYYTDEQILYD